MREVSAAGSLATVDVLAGDADVVGRSAPAQVDLAATDCAAGQRPRRRRRLAVGGLGGGAEGVGVGPCVAGGVGRPDAVAVAGGGGEAGVVVGRPGRCRDLGEVRAVGALAALYLVAGDADVVVCRAPAQIDLAATDCAAGQRSEERRVGHEGGLGG